MECSDKEEKPLTIDKAAFLLLRVRRVFKKKLQLKKEKNGFAQEGMLPKSADLSQINLSKLQKKKRIPHLIRSRTVPAIIVPFTILQAHITKNASSANYSPAPNTTHPSCQQDLSLKRGSCQITVSSRDSISLDPSDSSLLNISVTVPTGSGNAGNLLEPCSWADTSASSLGVPGAGAGSNKPSLGRFARLLNSAGEERRKSSVSLQHYHLSQSHQPPPLNQHEFLSVWDTSGEGQSSPHRYDPHHTSSKSAKSFWNTPKLPRRRRSLEAEDFQRPRADSVDSFLKTHFLLPDGTSRSYSAAKRLSTGSANQTKLDDHKYNQGLLVAVQEGNVDMVKSILESSEIDINSLSVDGLSLLDVVVIQRNSTLVKLLLANGATERLAVSESIGSQLDTIVQEAEKKSEDLMARLLKCSTFGNLSAVQLKELEKEFHQWERRYKKYRKMRSDYHQLKPPEPPSKVIVDVLGSTTVRLRLDDASDIPEKSICTKYKIEWSLDEDFPIGISTKWIEMLDLRKLETVLGDLETGERYFFRVAAGNCKGYGPYQASTPTSVIPSSWRDLDGRKSRYAGKSIIFDDILREIQKSRPEYASESHLSNFRAGDSGSSCQCKSSGTDSNSNTSGSTTPVTSSTTISATLLAGQGIPPPPAGGCNQPGCREQNKPAGVNVSSSHHYTSASSASVSTSSHHQKKNQKIISIKQLFAAAPKFQKHFKRGIFLSCIMYSGDKLLVTTEEFLPTIEIDETFPSSLHNDFHWLLKVASTWEDIKFFKADMEKSRSASTFHFRLKLLQAAAAMQNALGVTDLGRIFYKTIRDAGNSVVIITTINYLRSTKMISTLNVRWVPLTKLNSRKSTDDVADILINSLQEQILYHQVSNIPVGRGLYLGYLKLASSMDLLKILVAEKTPNMLPHAKIRDNPHVSGEEWTFIQSLAKPKSMESLCNPPSATGSNSSIYGIKSNEEEKNGTTDSGTDILSSKQLAQNKSKGQSYQQRGALTEAQQLFKNQLTTALKRLFTLLDIDQETSLTHRFYNAEVIEVSSSVSMVIVFPSLENVCLLAGQSDNLLQRNDLIPLPMQVFEMIHLSTYQKDFVTRYARLSAILEMDTILAQHNQREAFSSVEMASAKERMSQLQDLQSKIDSTWKGSRWVIDVVTASRDKSLTSASVQAIFDVDESRKSCDSIHSADEPPPQHPAITDEDSGFGSTGLKFSRSENQLSHIGESISSFPDASIHQKRNSHSSHTGSLHSDLPHHSIHAPVTRKVSVPMQNTPGGGGRNPQEKMMFKPKIYSTHSQSDSTISQSSWPPGSAAPDPTSSLSLHNLHRDVSSNKISPSIPTPDSNQPSEVRILPKPPPSPTVITPSTASITSTGSTATAPIQNSPPFPHTARVRGKIVGEPPPVPPRRTIPPGTVPSCQGISHAAIESSSPIDFRVFPPTFLQSVLSPNSSSSSTKSIAGVGAPLSRQEVMSSQILDSSASLSSSGSSGITISTTVPEDSSLLLLHRQLQSSSPPPLIVIQVYAAYDSGLSEGTSVKLQITNQTSARQVVDLFVKQLNSEVRGKGMTSPIYEKSQDFCLVAIVGARERCLRDDFKPLLVQDPWKQGKFYVRKKNEVTAAIDLHARKP